MPSITIRNLTKQYTGEDGQAVTALDHIDLHIKDGEFVCIVGPSGCGKSTMLEIVAGLLEKSGGEVLLDDEPVTGPSRDIGVVFQDASLYPWKTVKKNIQYPLKVNGLKDKAELERIAQEHLDMVGLSDKGDLYPHQLSGGMKQRVAIAKGLALNPKIILMDEPFASLDAMTRNKLQAELLRIKEKENATVIFITHNIQEALVLGNRVMLMSRRGEIKIDIENKIPKPVTPASEGYGQMWKMFNDALWEENDDNQ